MWLHSLKLTVRTWKWMVGIRSFPFGFRPIFRGKLAVSFRESTNFQSTWYYLIQSSTSSWSTLTRPELTPEGSWGREFPPKKIREIHVDEMTLFHFGQIKSDSGGKPTAIHSPRFSLRIDDSSCRCLNIEGPSLPFNLGDPNNSFPMGIQTPAEVVFGTSLKICLKYSF